jgi:hypothetical protein
VENDKTAPKSVLVLRERVRALYRAWWMTHYFIGLLGVVAGTLLTALTAAPDHSSGKIAAMFSLLALKEWAWLIGLIAAVCTSLVTFLGPIGKAERYWDAYHVLDQACLEYEKDALPLKKFLSRVSKARALLRATTAIDGDDKADTDGHADGNKANVTKMEQKASTG